MLLSILVALSFSQAELTIEEQTECVSNLEFCQAQVGSLVSALTQEEYPAAQGTFTTCEPGLIQEMGVWWEERLSDLSAYDLYVCNDIIPYWAILMPDGTYRSTCVAFSNDLEGACPSDEIYCSLLLDDVTPVYGYAGNILQALTQALETTTYTHPWCPKGSCAPINDWLASQMELEGISSEEAGKICTYGESDKDQYYYIVDTDTVVNTCVVSGDTWDIECNADAGRVCAAISEGMNVVGWPRQQARFIAEALTMPSFSHPQCKTA